MTSQSSTTQHVVEYMSVVTAKYIHHALRGQCEERVIQDSKGHEVYQVDGYEPIPKTIYQYHGCK